MIQILQILVLFSPLSLQLHVASTLSHQHTCTCKPHQCREHSRKLPEALEKGSILFSVEVRSADSHKGAPECQLIHRDCRHTQTTSVLQELSHKVKMFNLHTKRKFLKSQCKYIPNKTVLYFNKLILQLKC